MSSLRASTALLARAFNGETTTSTQDVLGFTGKMRDRKPRRSQDVASHRQDARPARFPNTLGVQHLVLAWLLTGKMHERHVFPLPFSQGLQWETTTSTQKGSIKDAAFKLSTN